jgi:hypothetical protein
VDELTDAALWRSVEVTGRDVILPAVTDEWVRASLVQLIGLARYAASRPPDPTAARVAELLAVLGSLDGNALVVAEWTGETTPASVVGAVARILARAVGRADADADAVRRLLRPVVVRQLDDELAVTGALVGAFRGQLDA